ncbi:MAG: hypothetical protein ACRCYQ_09760 [Nocardioides sp.]
MTRQMYSGPAKSRLPSAFAITLLLATGLAATPATGLATAPASGSVAGSLAIASASGTTAASRLSSAPSSPLAMLDATAGESPITARATAEIRRVLDSDRNLWATTRSARRAQAADAVRCADFEGQRYCLGIGWTTDREARVRHRIAEAATAVGGVGSRLGARAQPDDRQTAAPSPAETTGDRDALAILAHRAGLAPEERRKVERRELRQAARSVAKIWLLRHQIQGVPLPAGFATDHREVRLRTDRQDTGQAGLSRRTAALARTSAYPERSWLLDPTHVNDQRRTYWCGPTTIQMIAWTKSVPPRRQRVWAQRLGTTASGTEITEMVRVINRYTTWDSADRAGPYVVLDVGDFTFRQWITLVRRHVSTLRAPMVMHPVLRKEYFPYLDDNGSGHFQVGRGYNNNGDKQTLIGFFEPWNQQRFDPSEPYIDRVQWRSAYKSYRANQEHFLHNIGV